MTYKELKMAKHTMADLLQMQTLPLEAKIGMTRTRIKAWVNEFGEDGVYVAFSGGKDSTVLLDIVRNVCGYNKIPAAFVDVPTQFPELRDFATSFENVTVLRPHISFMQVCEQYGFPLISKDVAQAVYDVNTQSKRSGLSKRDTNLWDRYFNPDSEYGTKYPAHSKAKFDYLIDAPFECSHRCCEVMKKKPSKVYEKKTGRKPILATMACESRLRQTQWLQDGCNAFDVKRPTSKPMSFWTEQDILRYIKSRNLKICSVYGDVVIDLEAMGEMEGQSFLFETGVEPLKTTGMQRTGCMLCGFGCHLDGNPSRFEILKETHPKMYNLLDVCKNNDVTFREAIEWTNEHGNLNIRL
jgi:3'-phosphoadenosine 5'-phosphosulfate sulfotransferase (PAPS reductase)/FAD synthetase